MAEYVTKEQVIDWYRSYGQTDEPIPFETLVSDLRDMKTADVDTVRHGRWISWEKAGNFVPSSDRHECSVCHDAAQVLVNGFELLSDYCPNCGAKMMEG